MPTPSDSKIGIKTQGPRVRAIEEARPLSGQSKERSSNAFS